MQHVVRSVCSNYGTLFQKAVGSELQHQENWCQGRHIKYAKWMFSVTRVDDACSTQLYVQKRRLFFQFGAG